MNEFLSETIGQWMSNMAVKYEEDLFVKYTDREYTRSWREFDEECDIIARAFMALGLKKGDHIAIWASNVPEWLLTLFGAVKFGGVLITVNTSYKVFELEYQLRQSDTKALVMIDGFKTTSYVDVVNELIPTLKDSAPGDLHFDGLPELRSIIYVGAQCPAGMVSWDSLPALAEQTPYADYAAVRDSCTCHEVVNIQYTSGTTGFPKGVMLTHHNILNNGKCIGDCMRFTHEDKLCITVPFFHCFGLVLALMASITHGTAIVPIDIFSPEKVMDAVSNEKCSALHGVPTMFIAMMEHEKFDQYDFSSMRTGIMAGSPCPIKTMQDVVDKMNMSDITIVFGQTESSPGCTQTTIEDSLEHRVSTVGRNLPSVQCKVVDPETGADMADGQIGEFVARGYNIMKGYYKMPEATQLAIDADGWLHTGDLAVRDADGYYKITGRLKDMIIRGGENIYPKELEECLYHHEAVRDVQVLGVPSAKYGEEICACVVLREGQNIDEAAIKAYYAQHMAHFKIPSYVWFVEDFPMTASGKIQKYKLREGAIEHFALQDAAKIETA